MMSTWNFTTRAGGRRIVRWAPLAVAAILLPACGGNKDPFDLNRMTYGAPPAKVSAAGPPSTTPYSGLGVSIAPAVATAPNAPTHDIRLDVTHQVIQVGDTAQYLAWTFGGHVPGPVIHVREGDRVKFTLVNRSDQSVSLIMAMPHSIDFQSGMVNPADKWQPVGPGAQLEFEWVANYPGVFLYHCATPPVLQHMAAGMYGMVIVDPKGGFPTRVDREYALVQSELYLGARKRAELIDLNAAMRKTPTYVVFNGAPNRHVTEPLQAKPGERVRLYVLNAGPNGTSSFHVIGTILDRVWLDGDPINELRGMQTVMIPASGAATVEFVIPEDGIYTFVDHEFADAEMGATGRISTMPAGAAQQAAGH